jgi:hypothetical protein
MEEGTVAEQKSKAKGHKALREAKINPDDLLMLDEEVQAEVLERKVFDVRPKYLINVECPYCHTPTVIANNAGLVCASCVRPLTLGLPTEPENAVYTPPSTLEYIMDELVPEWQVQFAGKNADYGAESAAILGAAGQYADMNRKMTKLKRSLWDGEDLTGEQPREILLDLIGHCFLTIDMIDKEGDLA